MDITVNAKDGWLMLPSSLRSPDGRARFHITFPREFASDAGANHLVVNELKGGYEKATRDFLERTLRRGDLFVDVGAHWGFFSLQAATHPAGDIAVIAFEPDPTNAAILFRGVARNGLIEKVAVVSAACGDVFDVAPLVANSTMMHSIRGIGLKPPFARGPSRFVPVVTLDQALARLPQAADARIMLKVDAEGFEPQVIAGATELLASGRVEVIVWECGHAFADGPERDAMREMVGALSALGYRHLRPITPAEDSLMPFDVEVPYNGNVISRRADVAAP